MVRSRECGMTKVLHHFTREFQVECDDIHAYATRPRGTIEGMSAPVARTQRVSASRIVVGSAGDDTTARLKARALLLSGHEVVFIGGHQSVDQLAHTAVAEDAGRVVVDAPDVQIEALRTALQTLQRPDVAVEKCGE